MKKLLYAIIICITSINCLAQTFQPIPFEQRIAPLQAYTQQYNAAMGDLESLENFILNLSTKSTDATFRSEANTALKRVRNAMAALEESGNIGNARAAYKSIKTSINQSIDNYNNRVEQERNRQAREEARRREEAQAAKRAAAEEEARREAMKPKEWSGSGFALKGGYLVTNYHVIENAKTITVKGIKGDLNERYSAVVVASDRINDLAILKINDSRFGGFGSIPYSIKGTLAEVGEEVFHLGYPLTSTMGEEIKYFKGDVGSRTGFQGDVSSYQISAAVQPGNSGCPLFDRRGNLIGIVVAKHIGAESVGYAVKSTYLKKLIEGNNLAQYIPTNNTIASVSRPEQIKAIKKFVFLIECSDRFTGSTLNNKKSSVPENQTGGSKPKSSPITETPSSPKTDVSPSTSNYNSQFYLEKADLSKKEITIDKGGSAVISISNYDGSDTEWSIKNSNIASIENCGAYARITGLEPGVTAVFGKGKGQSYWGACTITVESKMSLSTYSIEMYEGESKTIIAYDYGKSVTWETNSPTIARIMRNAPVVTIKAGGVGYTTIFAHGKQTLSCKVRVKPRPMSLSNTKIQLYPGKKYGKIVTAKNYGANIDWKITNNKIAKIKVDTDNPDRVIVYGNKIGETELIAAGSDVLTCKIEVNKNANKPTAISNKSSITKKAKKHQHNLPLSFGVDGFLAVDAGRYSADGRELTLPLLEMEAFGALGSNDNALNIDFGLGFTISGTPSGVNDEYRKVGISDVNGEYIKDPSFIEIPAFIRLRYNFIHSRVSYASPYIALEARNIYRIWNGIDNLSFSVPFRFGVNLGGKDALESYFMLCFSPYKYLSYNTNPSTNFSINTFRLGIGYVHYWGK